MIKTDQYSLKFLLKQKIITSPQQRWISKLLGFNFGVEYQAGHENVVADALSRQKENEGMLTTISTPQLSFFNAVRSKVASSQELQQLVDKIAKGVVGAQLSYTNGLIFFKGKVYISSSSPLP